MFWILVTALLLGFIVTTHELGHYLAARACGVKAERFSIGIGPRIISIQPYKVDDGSTLWRVRSALLGKRFLLINLRHRLFEIRRIRFLKQEDEPEAAKDLDLRVGTEWVITPFLFAGYVGFKAPAKDEPPPSDTIPGRPLWQQIVISLAGPLTNLSLAVVGLTVLFSVGTETWYDYTPSVGTITNSSVLITKMTSDFYEGELDLLPGDQVLSVNGVHVETSAEAYKLVNAGENTLTVLREPGDVRITTLNPDHCTGCINNDPLARCGVLAIQTKGMLSLPLGYSLALAGGTTLYTPVLVTQGIIKEIEEAFRRRGEQEKETPDTYIGVAMIVEQVSNSAHHGWRSLLNLAVTLSLVIGWMNLIPIPPLDGGQIIRYAAEPIAGPRLKFVLNHSWIAIGLLLMGLEISFIVISSIHDMLLWLFN